jgi:8-oxo-dGTP pyrophosphatase MutT (NUDIX family)
VSRPLIVDPRAAPVVGVDDHLPALSAHLLTPSAVRERFARHGGHVRDWRPEIAGDGSAWSQTTSPASVLVPLVERDRGLGVLLTRRTDHLRAHAGQISFPGGRREPDDADAVAAALREAEEEVGLSASDVEVVGTLPPYTTVTAFEVTPVVALVRPDLRLAPDPHEVAEVFEVPLAFLMTPAHHRRHEVEIGGVRRHFLSMPWHAPNAAEPYFIWGATAAMLRNLYRFLGG